MNVQLPKEYKVRKRDIVIYTICIIICVVALTIVVTMQVLGEGITNKVFQTSDSHLLPQVCSGHFP